MDMDHDHLIIISETFNRLGYDPRENIRILVETCGSILDCVCTLYNRLEPDERLSVRCGYNLPGDMPESDIAKGHICYEATIPRNNTPVIIEDVNKTRFAQTDPYVKKYNIRSYLGFPVQCEGRGGVGSLCMVDTKVRKFTEKEISIISIFAKSLSLEESRIHVQHQEKKLIMMNAELQKEIWIKEKTKTQLVESERFLTNVLNTIGDSICVLTKEMKIIRANRSLEQKYGNRLPLTGKTCFEVFHNLKDCCNECPVKKTFKTGKLEIAEIPFPQESGTTEWEEIYAFPFLDDEGNITGAVRYSRDITPRKHAENAILESEHKYRELAESIPEAVFEIDETGKLLYLSKAGMEKLNIPEVEQEKSLSLFSFFPEKDKERVVKYIEGLVSGKKPKSIEVVIQPENRPAFPALLYVRADLCDRRKIKFRGIAQDISKIKEAETALLRAKKNEAARMMAGGISHDFNNLLYVISGNISLALDSVPEKSDVYSKLTEAKQACKTAGELTRKFITFSTGGDPVCQHIPILPLIEEARQISLKKPGIQCRIRVEENLKHVYADENQLLCILSDLLQNAQEATGDEGDIQILVKRVNITPQDACSPPLVPGPHVCISVSDNGTGILPAHLPMIFDPYFSTKARGKDKGMGLGLSISDAMVRKHKGHMVVESKEGKGTTVYVFLPVTDSLPHSM